MVSDPNPCEGTDCGTCSKNWHCLLELNWYHKFPRDSEFIQHYTEVDNQLLAKHGNRNVIFECTQNCRCVREGTCKNNAMMRLAQNPLPFGTTLFMTSRLTVPFQLSSNVTIVRVGGWNVYAKSRKAKPSLNTLVNEWPFQSFISVRRVKSFHRRFTA